MPGTLRTVVVAFGANLTIAAAKLAGAALTASTSLLAEGLHSVIDTGNEIFLYLGLHLEQQTPSPEHPFGFGRERYFWSFMAAVFIFAGGAVVALYEGIDKWRHPHALSSLGWAYGILAFALLAEGTSLLVSLHEARLRARPRGLSVVEFLRLTRDSTLLTVVLEDSAAMLGLTMAAAGISLATLTGDSRWDAAGSLAIGGLLVVLAFVLGARNHALLIGKSATRRIRQQIEAIIRQAPGLAAISDCYTIQMAPDKVLLAAHLVAAAGGRLHREIPALERQLQAEVPFLHLIFLEVVPAPSQGD